MECYFLTFRVGRACCCCYTNIKAVVVIANIGVIAIAVVIATVDAVARSEIIISDFVEVFALDCLLLEKVQTKSCEEEY